MSAFSGLIKVIDKQYLNCIAWENIICWKLYCGRMRNIRIGKLHYSRYSFSFTYDIIIIIIIIIIQTNFSDSSTE